jgi:hypothetical protein
MHSPPLSFHFVMDYIDMLEILRFVGLQLRGMQNKVYQR